MARRLIPIAMVLITALLAFWFYQYQEGLDSNDLDTEAQQEAQGQGTARRRVVRTKPDDITDDKNSSPEEPAEIVDGVTLNDSNSSWIRVVHKATKKPVPRASVCVVRKSDTLFDQLSIARAMNPLEYYTSKGTVLTTGPDGRTRVPFMGEMCEVFAQSKESRTDSFLDSPAPEELIIELPTLSHFKVEVRDDRGRALKNTKVVILRQLQGSRMVPILGSLSNDPVAAAVTDSNGIADIYVNAQVEDEFESGPLIVTLDQSFIPSSELLLESIPQGGSTVLLQLKPCSPLTLSFETDGTELVTAPIAIEVGYPFGGGGVVVKNLRKFVTQATRRFRFIHFERSARKRINVRELSRFRRSAHVDMPAEWQSWADGPLAVLFKKREHVVLGRARFMDESGNVLSNTTLNMQALHGMRNRVSFPVPIKTDGDGVWEGLFSTKPMDKREPETKLMFSVAGRNHLAPLRVVIPQPRPKPDATSHDLGDLVVRTPEIKVVGIVQDQSKRPVSGAYVSLTGKVEGRSTRKSERLMKTRSDVKGFFQLYADSGSSEMNVSAYKVGYESASSPVSQDRPIFITMGKRARVSGRLIWRKRLPLFEATIKTNSSSSRRGRTANVAEDGAFEIDNLSPGEYQWEVTFSDANKVKRIVELPAFTVEQGQDLFFGEIAIPDSTLLHRFQVVNAKGRDGKKIEVAVSRPESWRPEQRTSFDKDEFSLASNAGAEFEFYLPGYRRLKLKDPKAGKHVLAFEPGIAVVVQLKRGAKIAPDYKIKVQLRQSVRHLIRFAHDPIELDELIRLPDTGKYSVQAYLSSTRESSRKVRVYLKQSEFSVANASTNQPIEIELSEHSLKEAIENLAR